MTYHDFLKTGTLEEISNTLCKLQQLCYRCPVKMYCHAYSGSEHNGYYEWLLKEKRS